MIADTLLNLLYPKSCVGCGTGIGTESRYLCWDCLSELVLIREPFCSICGDPVEGRVDTEYACLQCASEPPHFDRARSAARFDRVVRQMVLDFKYHQAMWIKHNLVELLRACLATYYGSSTFDAVCYVPLYRAKQRQRGYNQAALLAAALARDLHKPLLAKCLVRVRPTSSQTNLTARQRAINVKDAIQPRWSRWLNGRRILLVDDVMTTGATVNECARALKQGGAASVHVVTVARG